MKLKKGLNVPKSSKSKKYIVCFLSNSLIFEIDSTLKQPPAITFGETRAYTSRKHVGVVMPN